MSGIKFFFLNKPVSVFETNSEELFRSFLSLFAFDANIINTKITYCINSDFKITPEFKTALKNLVDMYGQRVPKLNEVYKKFILLPDNEFIYLIPSDVDLDSNAILQIEIHLAELNGKVLTNDNGDRKYFENLLNNYNIMEPNTAGRKIIGDRVNKICRFCGRGKPEVTFRKKAHVISSGFGNKNLIHTEECDSCNEAFGRIEQDFLNYLAPYRVYFGNKNKENTVVKIKNKNNEIMENINGDMLLKIHSNHLNSDEGKLLSDVELHFDNPISLQNIYRILCKFAICVVDKNLIKSMKGLIDWVNGNYDFIKLPKIAVLNNYPNIVEHPRITVYVRKTDNKNLPEMVGEFKYAYLIFAYIMPVNDYEIDYDMQANQAFEDCFWHYTALKDKWGYMDLSDSNKKPLVFSFKFVQKNNN